MSGGRAGAGGKGGRDTLGSRPPDPALPDYGRGFLRVPHAVWMEVYCQAPLTRRQLQIVSVVLRESWGWRADSREGRVTDVNDGSPGSIQKRKGSSNAAGPGVRLWTRPLTPRAFARATGLSTDHLARDLRDLVSRGILREREGCYQFIGSPKEWQPKSKTPPHCSDCSDCSDGAAVPVDSPAPAATINGRSSPQEGPDESAISALPSGLDRKEREY